MSTAPVLDTVSNELERKDRSEGREQAQTEMLEDELESLRTN